MNSTRHLIALGVSATCLAACVDGSAPTSEPQDDLSVGSVQQAEVVACPAAFAAEASAVKYEKELMIIDTAVVDDPCRTVFNPPAASCPDASVNGHWSFWYLMTQMAGSNNVSRFVLKWLESFESSNIVVNDQVLAARTKIRSLVINPWRQASNCALDKNFDDVGGACTLNANKAPLRLLAIVNRADLRSGGAGDSFYGGGDAGEGRFVFGFTNLHKLIDASGIVVVNGNPSDLLATMNFEFKIPTANRSAQTWAQDWRALGSSASFDTAYKAKLQAITDRFVNKNVAPGSPNIGNAIAQVRSDELEFDSKNVMNQKVWSMREFKLGCLPGVPCGTNDSFIVNTTTAQTPPNSVNGTAVLDSFLTTNQASILAGTHGVPKTFGGVPFLAGDSTSPSTAVGPMQWNRANQNDYFTDPANGTVNQSVCSARRIYAFSTCNGCHYLETDNTGNLHIKNRRANEASVLSPFLTGLQNVSSNDPCEPTGPRYNEPARRKCELVALANGATSPVSVTTGRPH